AYVQANLGGVLRFSAAEGCHLETRVFFAKLLPRHVWATLRHRLARLDLDTKQQLRLDGVGLLLRFGHIVGVRRQSNLAFLDRAGVPNLNWSAGRLCQSNSWRLACRVSLHGALLPLAENRKA